MITALLITIAGIAAYFLVWMYTPVLAVLAVWAVYNLAPLRARRWILALGLVAIFFAWSFAAKVNDIRGYQLSLILFPVLTAFALWWRGKSLIEWIKERRSLIGNYSVAVVTIVLCLSAWEIYLRNDSKLKTQPELESGGGYRSPCTSEAIGWLHTFKPNTRKDLKKIEYVQVIRANSIGLNDLERKLHSDSTNRIAALGDSFTEGAGQVGDSAYPKILQTLLTKTEVMNCGVSGSDPVYEYKLLQQRILSYHPTIVTIAINNSDLNDAATRGGFERFLPDSTIKLVGGAWWEPVFASSFIVRHIVLRVMHYNFYLASPKQQRETEAKAVQVLSAALDSTATLCRVNGIRCIFIFHPQRTEIEDNKQEMQPVLDYARRRGYEVIDLLAYFRRHGMNAANAKNFYWPLDRHNNNRGYALFAQGIADYLKSTADVSSYNSPVKQ